MLQLPNLTRTQLENVMESDYHEIGFNKEGFLTKVLQDQKNSEKFTNIKSLILDILNGKFRN